MDTGGRPGVPRLPPGRDAGAAADELMAQYGWIRLEQAEVYTRGADRARLGMQASEVVAGQIENNIPRTSDPDAPHLVKTANKSVG